ncbi:hypothetical protein RHSIM_Rhsim07G0227700 [Rhododendron simsii]|uniref:Late embryogenesis abundant protein LEA-2 subgroup domain-containing protein n=1 Tax=Rhododendron simsii TaxID=118357 RepID=A0A834GQY7_RHOSS|nr:hypothetical protein RHSIM_Rhsim07G0227700 [Rhododendron simsii]
MHIHAKTDSEVTSLAASSPPRSPRRQPYYVQSPSRDSHDGEKTTTSFHSTPIISPAGSPPHSHSSVGRHSRESSSSRFSGSLKPGSRKISPNDAVSGGRRKWERKEWKDCEVIEEEGLLDDEEERRGGRRRCYLLAFVVGFFVLFSLFSLILWGASKPQKPKITVKSITFENLRVQAGSDSTGVATQMISMNSTVKLIFRNTATFFGVHVSSTPVDLSYDQITIGSGTIIDKEVLPIKEKPKIGICLSDGRHDSSVRERSEFEQFVGDDNVAGASETELRCSIKRKRSGVVLRGTGFGGGSPRVVLRGGLQGVEVGRKLLVDGAWNKNSWEGAVDWCSVNDKGRVRSEMRGGKRFMRVQP